MSLKNQPSLTRKQLADAVGAGAESIRFYDARGLIGEPERSAAGYRLYRARDVARLRFIRRAQKLGFTLNEILELIQLTEAPHARRSELRKRTDAKLRQIEGKILDLRAMTRSLKALLHECDGKGPIQGCPIFEYMKEDRNGGENQ